MLAHVRDPGNAGTVIRAADAAGADAVRAHRRQRRPVQRQVRAGHRRAACSTCPSCTGDRVEDDLPRAAGRRAAGSSPPTGTRDLDLDDATDSGLLDGPTAWVFGNEAWGLPEPTRALADAVVRVPIHGRAESLNLATAAAVCLYASARAHRTRPSG